MDQELNDFASAMTLAVARDGQNVPTADLPMGGFAHTNVANAGAVTEYLRAGQYVQNTPIYMTDQAATASTDIYCVTPTFWTSVSANQAPSDGTLIYVRIAGTNTGTPALYFRGHSANIVNASGSTIAAGLLPNKGIAQFVYNSAYGAWQWMGGY